MHDVHRAPGSRVGNDLGAARFKAVGIGDGIVTHPDFKQVTQDEYGIGRRAVQVLGPSIQGRRIGGLQMQVRNEIDAPPLRWCVDVHHRILKYQSATAFSMTTSSLGTSS